MQQNSIISYADISDLLILLVSENQHLKLSRELQAQYKKDKSPETLKDLRLCRLVIYAINHRIQRNEKALNELINIIDRSLTDKQIIVLDSFAATTSAIVMHKAKTGKLKAVQHILNNSHISDHYGKSTNNNYRKQSKQTA